MYAVYTTKKIKYPRLTNVFIYADLLINKAKRKIVWMYGEHKNKYFQAIEYFGSEILFLKYSSKLTSSLFG
jgi:hypothetical protein